MCYFVEINLTRQQLQDRFNVPMPFDPRYMPGFYINAFTRPYLPVITGHDPERISLFRWGLIPFWVRDEETAVKISNGTFNAKSETIREKPAFRDAARNKHCLVLSHGFFEWYTAPGKKIPFYIRRKDGEPFAFAGLFDSWTNRSTGEVIETFSIITTRANSLLEKIHNSKKRMPVILPAGLEKSWLDPGQQGETAAKLLEPLDADELEAWSISRKVSSRDVDPADADLITPIDYPETASLLTS